LLSARFCENKGIDANNKSDTADFFMLMLFFCQSA
jgi:hypothetical protein